MSTKILSLNSPEDSDKRSPTVLCGRKNFRWFVYRVRGVNWKHERNIKVLIVVYQEYTNYSKLSTQSLRRFAEKISGKSKNLLFIWSYIILKEFCDKIETPLSKLLLFMWHSVESLKIDNIWLFTVEISLGFFFEESSLHRRFQQIESQFRCNFERLSSHRSWIWRGCCWCW